MEVLKERYTITELSDYLQITDHALRYYEREFKICVPKDARGRRYYPPELANIMYQIKNMREQGLEIKAIRNILQSENIISEPPPVVVNQEQDALLPVGSIKTTPDTALDKKEIKQFFEEFREAITCSLTHEIVTSKDQLTRELNKTKLELGACVENSSRKIEAKLEKHFQDVDRSLSVWRERNRKGIIKRIADKIMG